VTSGSGTVEVLVAAVLRRNERILVWRDFNPATGESVWMPLAGHIEFGETGEEAIRRELREEINATAVRIEYLGLLQDIFEWAHQKRHEIYLVYEVDVTEPDVYAADTVEVKDDDEQYVAMWRALADFDAHERLVPQGLAELIAAMSGRVR
jgi:8-oxo-dGTP pyrophosphatase MutT (NUDIX family)